PSQPRFLLLPYTTLFRSLFLAWLLVEDLPRKFLGNDMRLYFAKDALAVIVYLAFLAAWIQGRERRPRVGFLGPLLVFVGWGLVQDRKSTRLNSSHVATSY